MFHLMFLIDYDRLSLSEDKGSASRCLKTLELEIAKISH